MLRCSPSGRPGRLAGIVVMLLTLLALLALPGRAPATAADAVLPVSTGPDAELELENLTWTELRARIRDGDTTILVPIGGTEQSGPDIALGKHNARVRALAERIARALGHTLVAPVVAYVPEGSITPPSGHMRFPGTLTVPDTTFRQLLESTAESLRAHGFRTVVLLGDHGGYQDSLRALASQLNRRWQGSGAHLRVPVEYYQASSTGFAQLLRARGFRDDEIGTHAGLADTSLQLALVPGMVRQSQLAAGPPPGPKDGVYGGDPRRASAALGELGVQEIVRRTVQALQGADAAH